MRAITIYALGDFLMSALDQSALHQLYSEHNSWLKGWLRVRLGNAADASDLAQDNYLEGCLHNSRSS